MRALGQPEALGGPGPRSAAAPCGKGRGARWPRWEVPVPRRPALPPLPARLPGGRGRFLLKAVQDPSPKGWVISAASSTSPGPFQEDAPSSRNEPQRRTSHPAVPTPLAAVPLALGTGNGEATGVSRTGGGGAARPWGRRWEGAPPRQTLTQGARLAGQLRSGLGEGGIHPPPLHIPGGRINRGGKETRKRFPWPRGALLLS